MTETKGLITFQGGPLTLLGKQIKEGDVAPNFTAVKNDLSEFNLESLEGKIVVISSVPSLDTPVCELQTLRFNQEAAKYEDVAIVTISQDLPFAQGRFCADKCIKNNLIVSDYMTHDFANKYGLMIKELQLLTRAVVVIGKNGVVEYVEIVPEVTNQPDYDAVLETLDRLK